MQVIQVHIINDEIQSVLAFTAFGAESSMPDKKGAPEGEGGWGGGGVVASTNPTNRTKRRTEG